MTNHMSITLMPAFGEEWRHGSDYSSRTFRRLAPKKGISCKQFIPQTQCVSITKVNRLFYRKIVFFFDNSGNKIDTLPRKNTQFLSSLKNSL